MSFRLVPKSVTLNDLEWRNDRYFALFRRIWVPSGRTAYKFTFAISSPGEFLFDLVHYISHNDMTCAATSTLKLRPYGRADRKYVIVITMSLF